MDAAVAAPMRRAARAKRKRAARQDYMEIQWKYAPFFRSVARSFCTSTACTSPLSEAANAAAIPAASPIARQTGITRTEP